MGEPDHGGSGVNAFEEASEVERKALQELLPFLKNSFDRFVLTTTDRHFQRCYGDCFIEKASGHLYRVEFKAEEECKHGNIFLETWSNRSRYTRGWLDHLDTDKLLYYFCKERYLLTIDFPSLKRWAFHDGLIYEFPEKKQGKREQKNDTWGRCIPIKILKQQLPVEETWFDGPFGNVKQESNA